MGWANKLVLIESRIAYLYEKMNQDTLSREEYMELQYLLLWKYMLSDGDYTNMDLQEQTSVANIESDKVMFISNTHCGHGKETTKYVDTLYHYALQSGISTVIHAGDAIDGFSFCRPNEVYEISGSEFNSYQYLKEQLDRFLSFLPNPKKDGIQTKLLLGNRDYWAIRKAPLLLNDFFASKKIEILGINKVLLNFQKEFLIGLYHGISRERVPSSKTELVSLIGHSSDSIDYENTWIRIPQLCAMSHDSFDSGVNHSAPIFITLEQVDTEQFHFCQYSVDYFQTVHMVDETMVNTKTKQIIKRKK